MPLNIGVIGEVFALLDREGMRDAWSGRVVRKAMEWHTGRAVYQNSLLSCPNRYGLDGTVGGEVTEAHREHARMLLEGKAAKRAALEGTATSKAAAKTGREKEGDSANNRPDLS